MMPIGIAMMSPSSPKSPTKLASDPWALVVLRVIVFTCVMLRVDELRMMLFQLDMLKAEWFMTDMLRVVP